MKYMLDTNTCVFLMKNNANVVNQYKKKKASGIVISSITLAELYYGVYNSASVEKNATNLTKFMLGIAALKFNDYAAIEYGKVRALLRRKGTPIVPLDLLIAGHAKSKGLIIVTNNVHEFGRVDGLVVEDWTV